MDFLCDPVSSDLASRTDFRSKFEILIMQRQKSMVDALQAFEINTKFKIDKWSREEGGGGITCVIEEGDAFEKAGVNVSVVHGELSTGAVQQMKSRGHASINAGDRFFAAGISSVIHPRNPHVPTLHFNYRYFEVASTDGQDETWWFGGGTDLTPYYLYEDDVKHFHQTLKTAADRHDLGYYPKYKAWCDDYFNVLHRGERRGVGGIFFDDLTGESRDPLFQFMTDISATIVPCYIPIVERRHLLPSDERQREWQLIRRGRYVEFNLVYDRGTKFGLMTPGSRIESILMSLPKQAEWRYCHEATAGSPEAELVAVLRSPKDWEVCLLLLENYAKIDLRDSHGQTPFFLAMEAQRKSAAHLLVEWGADVNAASHNGRNGFTACKSGESVAYVQEAHNYYLQVQPAMTAGNVDVIQAVADSHIKGIRRLMSLRSRCISGSTLLHTAVYWKSFDTVEVLIKNMDDINVKDFKGAAPLHSAQDYAICQLLLDSAADVNATDKEGNTPLHLKCFGNIGEPTPTDIIKLLINYNANVLLRNKRGLLPIHCAAMQGRVSLINMLLEQSPEVIDHLMSEPGNIPSLAFLSTAYDYVDCAEWLMKIDIRFKPGEADELVRRLLADQLHCVSISRTLRFLLANGANSNPIYVQRNGALHYSAIRNDTLDPLNVFIEAKANLNYQNEDGNTALHFACQKGNAFTAAVLLKHGANHSIKNHMGIMAFELAPDLEEWLDSGMFSEEVNRVMRRSVLTQAKLMVQRIHNEIIVEQASNQVLSIADAPDNVDM